MGEEWSAQTRRIAEFQIDHDDEDVTALLLQDLERLFSVHAARLLPTYQILVGLTEAKGRPWQDFIVAAAHGETTRQAAEGIWHFTRKTADGIKYAVGLSPQPIR